MARGLTEDEQIRGLIGGPEGLAGLTTADKTSLIGAINEILAITGTGLKIDDATISTTKTWSSSKIDSTIDASVAALVDSSPTTLNTLNELAAALGDDPNFATTVTNSIGLKAPKANPVFTGTVTLPDGSLAIADTSGLQAALDSKLASVPIATVSVYGTVKRATELEVIEGADDLKYVSAYTLQAKIDDIPLGNSTVAGIAERADGPEADAGTDNIRFMTPLLVKNQIDAARPPLGNSLVAGIAERADSAEAEAGVDNIRFMTPLLVKNQLSTWDLGYRSKLATDAPNTYPKGYSMMLGTTNDGWPSIVGGFRNVVTLSGGYNELVVVQHAYPYTAAGQPTSMRTAASATTWNAWVVL